MYAEALLLLGQAHVDLTELRSAAEVAMVAIDMVSSMSAEQAIEIMRIIGQICHRWGDQRLTALPRTKQSAASWMRRSRIRARVRQRAQSWQGLSRKRCRH